MTHESNGLWFVELESPPGAAGTSQGHLNRERQEFHEQARDRGVEVAERMSFDELFNGLSVELDPGDVDKLREVPGVQALYPVETVSIPETTAEEPEMANALAMTGSDIAQSELGLSGDGLRVAVMDTGIDYTHPDLGGPGQFPTQRVVAGWDFVGDDFDAGHPDTLEPQPNPDPMDCHGHGTHVAGIVGAEGEVTGVAPDVEFGAYKVFGCDGITTADVMIAAMERALADDMDVLNMSIGSAFSWPQYPTAKASDELVRQGMVVVASIGNSGANGVYSSGAPGLGEQVIGVASYENSHISVHTAEANPSGEPVPYMPMSEAPEPPTTGTSAELVDVGRACVESEGDELTGDPYARVALIERGACTFDEKYAAAMDAGAEGVVIYNNVGGMFAGGGITDRGGFAIGISDTDGAHLRELLDGDEPVTLSWTEDQAEVPNPNGGLISSFSSYGMSPDLDLKPDIGAPGGLIRSTYPMHRGEYATVSGTSMSSPHVAGAAALLLEAHPDLRAPEVRTVLQNSANPTEWWGNPDLGVLDNVHRQGAGMLDVPAAVESTTILRPGKLAVGESATGSDRHRFRIVNNGSEPATYRMWHAPALGTHGSTFTPEFNSAYAQVTFRQDEVTVQPGRSAIVHVTITAPPDEQENMQYGGYLVADEVGGGEYRMPYAGFAGDYQSLEAMTSIEEVDEDGSVVERDVPWLTRITACEAFIDNECVEGGEFANQPDGATFTLDTVDGLPDIPYILVHFSHQVQRLEMVVTHAETGRPIHPHRNKAVDLEHVNRNATSTSYFTYPWDGTVTGMQDRVWDVPDGDYRLEVRALKALGDPKNDEHWETWTSPVITLDRG
ncbi:S8 family serine peptidase [Haloechinothrix sp. LS1_15]|nr:S8 family serine peptidase [Haloechinothrix sp. LS1_15]